MTMRLQASLGRLHQDISDRMDRDMIELTLAKIIAVHHKSGTCDVITINGDIYSDSGNGSGAPLLPQYMSGFDTETNKAWGSIRPVSIGTWVLLGFANKMKARPIILNIFPNFQQPYKNVYTENDLISEKNAGYERREAFKSLNVYPSMAYSKIDGEGNIEFSHPSKSFFAMYNNSSDTQDYLTDVHNGFDHMHLTETDKQTGEVLETGFEEAKNPSKALYVHRSNFNDEKTTWTKFFLDTDGLFRLTRDNNDEKLTFMEINKKGAFTLKRLLDAPYDEESKDFSSLELTEYGDILIKHEKDGVGSSIGVTSSNDIYMSHVSGSKLILDKDLYLELDGEIVSDSLQKFIESHHIVVSAREPKFPDQHLVWVDISDIDDGGDDGGDDGTFIPSHEHDDLYWKLTDFHYVSGTDVKTMWNEASKK